MTYGMTMVYYSEFVTDLVDLVARYFKGKY